MWETIHVHAVAERQEKSVDTSHFGAARLVARGIDGLARFAQGVLVDLPPSHAVTKAPSFGSSAEPDNGKQGRRVSANRSAVSDVVLASEGTEER